MLYVFSFVFLASVAQVHAFRVRADHVTIFTVMTSSTSNAFSFGASDDSSDDSSDSSETSTDRPSSFGGGINRQGLSNTRGLSVQDNTRTKFGETSSNIGMWGAKSSPDSIVPTTKRTTTPFKLGGMFGSNNNFAFASPKPTISNNGWNFQQKTTKKSFDFGSNFGKTTTKSPSGFQNLGFDSNFGKATTKKPFGLTTTKKPFVGGWNVQKTISTTASNANYVFGPKVNTPKPTTIWGVGGFVATTRKSWGGGGFEATTRKSRNPQPFNPTSRNVKNNKPRSTSGQDKPSSEDDDAASTALRIAMSVKDDKDKYDEKTLADAISIGMDSIKAKMEEFKKDISEDIFFRFLAKLSIENYEDDFDFYYREADAVDCKDLGIYDILVAYVADDRDMQGKITVCSGGHENLKYNQLTFKSIYFAMHCWNILCFCATFAIFQYVFIQPVEEMVNECTNGGLGASKRRQPNRAFKLNSYLY